MTEDDTATASSSATSAPLSFTSDMIDDVDVDDDVTSCDRDSSELHVKVVPLQQQQQRQQESFDDDEKKEEDHQAHISRLLSPSAAVSPCKKHPVTSDVSTVDRDKKSGRRTIRIKSCVLIFIIVTSTLLLTYTQTSYLNETYDQLNFQIRVSIAMCRTIANLIFIDRIKHAGLDITKANITTPMNTSNTNNNHRPTNWPDPPLNKFNTTKLIWAYWHSGESNLTPLGQISLQSWRAHHPSWKIIILSDDNYHEYIPKHHIPSTFHWLKVQFKSDIVRLSVLSRYGGAYLDMTSVLFKSLDGIWEYELNRVESCNSRSNLEGCEKRIFVPTVLELGERLDGDDYYYSEVVSDDVESSKSISTNGQEEEEEDDQQLQQRPPLSKAIGLVSNSVILSPHPSNPLLHKFLQRILTYSEHSATSVQELKSRPEFQRVLPYIEQYSHQLGLLGKDGTLLYSAHLWLFTDLVLFDQELMAGKYCVDLPALRWTYDFLAMPHALDKFDALGACSSSSSSSSCSTTIDSKDTQQQSLQTQLQQERIHTWNQWHLLKRSLWGDTPFKEFNNPQLAQFFLQDIAMIKTSTDGNSKQALMSYDDILNWDSTLGRLYRMAMVGTGMNATLEGARMFGYGARESCSFDLMEECGWD